MGKLSNWTIFSKLEKPTFVLPGQGSHAMHISEKKNQFATIQPNNESENGKYKWPCSIWRKTSLKMLSILSKKDRQIGKSRQVWSQWSMFGKICVDIIRGINEEHACTRDGMCLVAIYDFMLNNHCYNSTKVSNKKEPLSWYETILGDQAGFVRLNWKSSLYNSES